MYASAEDNGSHLTGDPQALIHIFLRAVPITSISIVFLVKGSGCCFAHWRSFVRTADWPAYLVAEDTQSEKDLGSFCGLKSGEVPDCGCPQQVGCRRWNDGAVCVCRETR